MLFNGKESCLCSIAYIVSALNKSEETRKLEIGESKADSTKQVPRLARGSTAKDVLEGEGIKSL